MKHRLPVQIREICTSVNPKSSPSECFTVSDVICTCWQLLSTVRDIVTVLPPAIVRSGFRRSPSCADQELEVGDGGRFYWAVSVCSLLITYCGYLGEQGLLKRFDTHPFPPVRLPCTSFPCQVRRSTPYFASRDLPATIDADVGPSEVRACVMLKHPSSISVQHSPEEMLTKNKAFCIGRGNQYANLREGVSVPPIGHFQFRALYI